MGGYDTTAGGLASLCAVFLFLTTVAIALRFYARRCQKAQYRLDDWLVLPAWILFVGLTAINFYGISVHFLGYPEPTDKVQLNAIFALQEKTYFALDILVLLAVGSVKLSALYFYRRVFVLPNKRDAFGIITAVAAGIVVCWIIGFFIFTFLLCGRDFNAFESPATTPECTNKFNYFLGITISDFILDALILLLPLPKIWSLHTNLKRKIAISGVFLLGLAGLAASCARMAITLYLELVGRPVNNEDSFQIDTQYAFYAVLECGLTLVAVNLPSLWYFTASITPERVLRSVRSLVSLGSGRHSGSGSGGGSHPSNRRTTNNPGRRGDLDLQTKRSENTKSSRTDSAEEDAAYNLSYPEGNAVEAHAMTDFTDRPRETDLESAPHADGTPAILVRHSFERTEQRV